MSAAKQKCARRANTGGQFRIGCRYTLGGLYPRQAGISIEEAKARLTIPNIWARLDLPGKPDKSCCSPFRADRRPSFSIYDNGGKWHDFATGEGGDAADFIAAALGVSLEEGCRCLIEMASGHGMSCYSSVQHPIRRTTDAAAIAKAAKRAGWPTFEKPTDEEIQAIADLRGLSPEGVFLAARRGLLRCCDSREGRAWIVADSSRRNAQGRLLSGQPWAAGMKARSLPGSEASWPVGLPEASTFSAIALCEGGADLLASLHLSWCTGVEEQVAPVAMMGASLTIPGNALPLFAGKKIRVFSDADNAGQEAGRRWGAQLQAAGVSVDGYRFDGLARADGKPVKDLNDFAHICVDHWEHRRDLIESAFDFAGSEGS